MRGISGFLLLLVGAILLVAANSFVIVPETQQGVVLRVGQPVNQLKTAGLYVKVPFIDSVRMFDRRILNADLESQEVPDKERRRLTIDAFVRYKIVDPLLFYQTLNSEEQAQARMRTFLSSSLRDVIANETMFELLSENRSKIMQDIRGGVERGTAGFGISVIDVRIRQADLPEQNVKSIIDRMVAERVREANEARAEGQELKNSIESAAEAEREILLAEARKQADIIRGEGDGERNRIYAAAFTRDPNFFAFYRSMIAYEQALGKQDTTMVLAPDSEFFRFLRDGGGR